MRYLSTFIALSILAYLAAASQTTLIKRFNEQHRIRPIQRQNSLPTTQQEKQSSKRKLEASSPQQALPGTPPQRGKLSRQSSMPMTYNEVQKAQHQTKSSPSDNTAAQALQVVMNHQTKRKYSEHAHAFMKDIHRHVRTQMGLAAVREAGYHLDRNQRDRAEMAFSIAREQIRQAGVLNGHVSQHDANYREAFSTTNKMRVAGLRDTVPYPHDIVVNVGA